MAEYLNAIGLVAGVLGIVSFSQASFPATSHKGPVVRIKTGLAQGDEEISLGGTIGALYSWDANNNYQGKTPRGHIGEGDFSDFELEYFASGRRGEYIGISAEEDAVCIAWITVTMQDGRLGGPWTGDIGSECGQAWYLSNEVAGIIKDTEKIYFPRCTWLDGDRSGDATVAAMKFATGAYGEDVEQTIENKKQCQSTLWGPDTGPIAGKPGKRSVKPRAAWMENRLVVSKISQHKAVDLCNSTTSWGPDFVGSDGMFCDMHTKTLTPVCSFHDTDGCVDVDADDKTISKRFTVAKRQVVERHKSYGTVSQWS